MIKLFL